MNTEKIKKELLWIRQFIHKKDDENVVIRDVNGKDIASWIDRVDAAIATPPAAPVQKPVGVVHHKPSSVFGADYEQVAVFTRALAPGTKLYDTPPAAQRQPLTKERIGQIIAQCQITLVNYCSDEKQTEFARAIEAAHGIGEKK